MPGISTQESRGKETNDAADPSAGTCTSIIVSVFWPATVPVLSSLACCCDRRARLSLPTSSRFIAAPSNWSTLPVVGIASVRLTDESATSPRYQPQPLVPRIAAAASGPTPRGPVGSRPSRDRAPPPAPAPPPADAPPRGRPARGSRRGG